MKLLSIGSVFVFFLVIGFLLYISFAEVTYASKKEISEKEKLKNDLFRMRYGKK